jgi:pimeloyl-ACP methyl ester carboxylesterase
MYKSAFALGAIVLCLMGSASAATAPAAPLPQVAAGGAPNIFYGGVNPAAAANSPVVVFVHGLGSNATYFFSNGNTMYQYVYNAGYRSAYVSLNADNSNDHNKIATNTTTLLGLLPQILQHFGVQQVYMFGHSEGGLEIQLAMLTPSFLSEVKAVFCIATPSQGTELAVWAFGTGEKIANAFGFLSPGLYDLLPTHVATLRAEIDPVLETAGVPFYTLEGSSYANQGALFYNITGPILMNLTNGVANDGLVAVNEVPLPDTYSEDMGEIKTDHTHMGFGDESWAYVYGRISGLENRFSGWKEIASGGYGDDANTWTWSQTWFQGNLFVGTGRQINCDTTYSAAIGSGLNLYPPPGNDCPDDGTQLGTGAEIWKYTPQTKTWVRVYKAPQTIPIGNDANGNPAFCATAIGFRGMTVYTESDGTQALYVGGVSGNSIYYSLPQFNPDGFPPPIILRSTDGVNFTPIPEDAGTFLGNLVSGNPDIQVASIRSLVQANGQMFAAVTNFRGEGFMIASPNPSQGDNAWQRVSPTPAVPNFAVWILASYNNALYVGTGDRQNDLGYGVYKTTNGPGDPTPYQFTPIIMDGGWQPDTNLRSPTTLSMHVWNDPSDGLQHLMCGTDRKIEIVRVNPDDSWDLVMGQPRSTPDGWKAPLSGIGYYFDNDFNGHIWQMQDETWTPVAGQANTNLGLHATTWDWSILFRNSAFTAQPTTAEEGFDHFYSPDATHWYIVSKDGMGDGLNMGGRSGVFSHFGLFWGTARVTGGTQEWQDLSMLDLNSDGQIDQNDVNIIQAAMGLTVATGQFDPRDLNDNGVIDAQDVQYLESQCTFPNCSTVPPPGIAYVAPPAPFQGYLVSQTQAVAGNNAQLSWPAQPNVARYHVYRYTTTPPLTLLLQGAPTQTLQISAGMSVTFPTDFTNGSLSAACPTDGSGEDLLWICTMTDALTNTETAPSGLTYEGFPAALQEIAQVAASPTPVYNEAMPTTIQSLYFIRSEDNNGNLSLPSNIVGAPSFNQQTALQ